MDHLFALRACADYLAVAEQQECRLGFHELVDEMIKDVMDEEKKRKYNLMQDAEKEGLKQ